MPQLAYRPDDWFTLNYLKDVSGYTPETLGVDREVRWFGRGLWRPVRA